MDLEIVTNIEGLDELEEAFTSGSRRAVRKFLTKVEKRAASILKNALSENAPYETGDLAGDIHINSIVSDGALTVKVGPSQDTFWGLFQEFGAPDANVPALHWAEEAAKSVQDDVLQEYIDATTEGLEDMKQ